MLKDYHMLPVLLWAMVLAASAEPALSRRGSSHSNSPTPRRKKNNRRKVPHRMRNKK